MAFTSVAGHLMEIAFPAEYKRWHGVPPAQLYDAPIHKQVRRLPAFRVFHTVSSCVAFCGSEIQRNTQSMHNEPIPGDELCSTPTPCHAQLRSVWRS